MSEECVVCAYAGTPQAVPIRSTLLACALTAALVPALAACGGAGGDAYGCSGGVCTATFEDSGQQDLSDELGSGATLRLEDVTGDSAVVTVAGRDAKLTKGDQQRVGGYLVKLEQTDGDGATIELRRAS